MGKRQREDREEPVWGEAISGGEEPGVERSETEGDGPPEIARGRPKGVDPEVPPRAKRRRFTTAYKLKILEDADGCTGPGELSALLRREGIYSSYLSTWRRERAAGRLNGTSVTKRGPKPKKDERDREIEKLGKENRRLQRKLAQAEQIIDIQKKVSGILELSMNGNDG